MLRSTYNALFKRKPASVLQGPKVTLFDQSGLPEPLRLPRPGEPLARISAGIADAFLAGACGLCVSGALHYGGGGGIPLDVVTLCGQSTGLLAWAFRDGLGRGGNRSPGKALFGLELAYADGTLVSPMAALCRSSYVLLLPAVSLHPFVGLSLEVLLFFDVATLVLTQDARKAGDYMWGSRVVEELPGRELRLLESREAVEIARLREKVAAAVPGLLEEEGLAEAQEHKWHTEVKPPTFSAGSMAQSPPAPAPRMGRPSYSSVLK
jgi:hypothetical protein